MDYFNFKKYLRWITPKQNNDGCYICGKGKTENNHLVRVADHAEICWANQYFDVDSLYVPRVNMCNKHHMIWHTLAEHRNDSIILSGQDCDKYLDLTNEIMEHWDEVPDKLESCYLDVVEDMITTIESNVYDRSNAFTHIEMATKQQYDNGKEINLNQAMLDYPDFFNEVNDYGYSA